MMAKYKIMNDIKQENYKVTILQGRSIKIYWEKMKWL